MECLTCLGYGIESESTVAVMQNAGRTLSRSRIAEAVWNYQFDSQTNVVDQYVTYLRRKLGTEGAAPEIVAVRGVGYRLEVA